MSIIAINVKKFMFILPIDFLVRAVYTGLVRRERRHSKKKIYGGKKHEIKENYGGACRRGDGGIVYDFGGERD
jgi:hypothetical protein